jgi:DNA sulfur modification protein DndD
MNDLLKLTPQGANVGSGFAVGGGNYRQSYVTVDGAAFNNAFGIGGNLPGNGSPISLDALDQISVSSSPYDVRLSGFTGGAISAVTKSGTNDFKGTIRILEKANGQGEAVLMNSDNTRIFNPNTALRTTYLMSVLFAIGKLATQRSETEFPLIFDAPTSSFTDAKETEFFNVISNLDKQVVIVTKSFLKESSDGNLVLDQNKVNEVSGRVFRIEKKKPFDDKDLATIQTVITKVK